MRIGTYGANQAYISRMLMTQQRMYELQTQIATEKKATAYSKISTQVNTLINFENEKSKLSQYVQGNTSVTTQLKAATTAMEGMRTTITQFRDALIKFRDGNTDDRQRVEDIQDFAFRSLLDLQSTLSVNVDGTYLFAGAKISTSPVVLPADTLAKFQSLFDGLNTTYPTTRETALFETHLTSKDTGAVSFDPDDGVIIPGKANGYSTVPAGSYVTISGTASNDGNYTIRSHALTNVNGNPLRETDDAGDGAFITHAGGVLDNATTGALEFKFNARGSMTVNTANGGTLWPPLSVGSKFTINGSAVNAYDGAFKVIGLNDDGSIDIATDTDVYNSETVSLEALTLQSDTDADGIPDTTVDPAIPLPASGSFALDGHTLTLTLPPGATDLALQFPADTPMTIGGTADHNGTYTVDKVETDGSGNTVISFKINPDAIRTSQFVPQDYRQDVTFEFKDPTGKTNDLRQIGAGAYGSLSFSPTGDGGETITASTAGAFKDGSGAPWPPVGTMITLKSTSGVNDGVYEVVSNDLTNIVVKSVTLKTETASPNARMDSTSWYKGDSMAVEHRIDTDRTVDIGLHASDPAFEKAIRAFSIIAQGAYGTAGGLENNKERIEQALYLLQDALEHPAAGTPPFGKEASGDVRTIEANIGFTMSIIKNKSDQHNKLISFYETRVSEIEGVNMTEAITKMLAEQTALQATYQTMAKVREMSLLNFLK